MLKLGAAKKEAGRAYGLLAIHTPDQPVTSETFHFTLDRKKLRQARRREGGYLLRSNITGDDPGHLWRLYLQLVEIEQAFKELKNDLSIRPVLFITNSKPELNPIFSLRFLPIVCRSCSNSVLRYWRQD